jgi:hypothetical protein
MTRAEQALFVANLTESVRDELLRKIGSGAIPETWDGHELRQLLADKFVYEVSALFREGKRSRRLREYRNTVIVNNL